MAHYAGTDPEVEQVIRRALSWHFGTKRAEDEAVRDVLTALDEAGYSIMKTDNMDGAI